MPRTISVAALQTSYGTDLQANIDKTIDLVREAASKGAQVILPSELFQGPYFCVTQEEDWFATAHPWREHPCVTALAPVAKDLGVAIPVSIFERDGLERGHARVRAPRMRLAEPALLLADAEVGPLEQFRRQDDLGALAGRFADQLDRAGDVGLHVLAVRGLQGGDAHCAGHQAGSCWVMQ